MISQPLGFMRPALSLAGALWLAHRRAIAGLASVTLLCGLAFRIMGRHVQNPEARDALGYIPMGVLLFLTFVFSGFTETDRRARSTGFPSRLFTLPVSTWLLVGVPILFGIAAVESVYAAWAGWVLPALGKRLPLAWPSWYLLTGVVAYQTVIWSLARFRIARILTLGIGGTHYAVGWIAFRNDFERELISWAMPEGISTRSFLCIVLAVLNLVLLAVAHGCVEAQRRGGGAERQGWRKAVEWITDTLAKPRRFDSPKRAQFWFEWRRHGVLLPLSVAGVLLIITVPSPFLQSIDADATAATVLWILVLPLLLAWVLGQGFGKSDLWSKDPAMPLFLATRPLSNDVLIGAKMRAAALAVTVSWVLIVLFIPWWVCLWGDWQNLSRLWRVAEALYSPSTRVALPFLFLGVLILLTWRLLVGSLFIGLSGKSWMLAAAACTVFVVILGTPFAGLALSQSSVEYKPRLHIPNWFPWALAGLFILKVISAVAVGGYFMRGGCIGGKAVSRYLLIWSAGTAFLTLAAWLMIPIQGWPRWLSALFVLFALPLLRAAFIPAALSRSRQR